MNFPGSSTSGDPQGGAQGYNPNDPNIKRIASLMESCYAKTAMAGVAGFGLGAVFGMFMASMAYDTPFTAIPAQGQTPAPSTAAGAATTATAKATKIPPPPPATAAAAIASSSSSSTTASAVTEAAAAAAPKPSAVLRASPLTAASASGAAAMATAQMPSAAGTVTLADLPLRQQLKHGFRDMGARSLSTARNFSMVGALFSGIECGIEGLRAKNDMANGVAAGCLAGGILGRSGGPQGAAVGCVGFAAFSAAIDAYLRMPSDD